MSLRDLTIATVGTGVMAESMLAGLLAGEQVPPHRIVASHPRADRRDQLHKGLGVRVVESNTEAVDGADIVVLGIKPQMLKKVGKELPPVLRPEQLVISILAGPTTTALANALRVKLGKGRDLPEEPVKPKRVSRVRSPKEAPADGAEPEARKAVARARKVKAQDEEAPAEVKPAATIVKPKPATDIVPEPVAVKPAVPTAIAWRVSSRSGRGTSQSDFTRAFCA